MTTNNKKISLSSTNDPILIKRYRAARIWQSLFRLSITIAIITLAVLLLTIINQSMGLAAIEYKVEPVQISEIPISKLSREEAISILTSHLSRSRLRALQADKPLDERSVSELRKLVMDRVANLKIFATWNLDQSIFQRAKIDSEMVEKYPDSHLEFKAWLNIDFLKQTMSSEAELAGVRTALLGSLFLIILAILVVFPLGLGAAIYLEEYANKKGWMNRVIQTNIDNLAGVPSIVYGILGLAIFVRTLSPLTSGTMFGIENENGRTLLSAGLTMAILILPILILNAQEAIRAVPNSLRMASYGLGATQWQTIRDHVLPNALPGILTGTILAISRAIGETAPLIVVGASTFITSDPNGPFSYFTALPIQIYNWTARPQDQFRNLAAAAILVLLITLLSMNAIAIIFRNKSTRQ
jgi:phosphate transport system permease protein